MYYKKIKGKAVRITTAIILICLTLNMYSCGIDKKEENIVKGFMWEITKNGNNNTIISTMNPMPLNYNNLNNEILKKLDEANGLLIKLDITNTELISALHNYRLLKEKDSVENYLTAKDVEKLEDILNSYDIDVDIEAAKTLNPMGLYNLITNLNYIETGFIANSNEGEIIAVAKAKNIPIIELLDLKNRSDIFKERITWDSLSYHINKYHNKNMKKMKEIADSIFRAYAMGDIDKLVAIENKIHSEDVFYGEYTELFAETNKFIAKTIDKKIASKDNYICTIDYRRLIGANNILLALEKEGYEVKRIY